MRDVDAHADSRRANALPDERAGRADERTSGHARMAERMAER